MYYITKYCLYCFLATLVGASIAAPKHPTRIVKQLAHEYHIGMTLAWLIYAEQHIYAEDEDADPVWGLNMVINLVQQGFAPAMNTLADCYLSGTVLEKKPALARAYYKKGADKGYGPAQFNYGVMCLMGDGGPKDPDDAVTYLYRALRNEDDLGDVSIDAGRYYREALEAKKAQQGS